MSRICRLKGYRHIGEDGRWAAKEIDRLRAELAATQADFSRLMEKHNAIHVSARETRDELAKSRNAPAEFSSYPVVHKKTGHQYWVTGEAVNATNEQSGQIMVLYRRDGMIFSRERGEFMAKFELDESSLGAE